MSEMCELLTLVRWLHKRSRCSIDLVLLFCSIERKRRSTISHDALLLITDVANLRKDPLCNYE